MKKLINCIIILVVGSVLSAQTILTGKISDEDGELIGANVTVFKSGNFVTGMVTDYNGNYSINLVPGTYDVAVSYVGYPSQRIENVLVKQDQITRLNVELETGTTLEEIVVVDYKVPIIEQDNTTSGQVITSDQIRALPTRTFKRKKRSRENSAKKAKAQDAIQVKGSRHNATDYYVDGIRVSGLAIPQREKGQPNSVSPQIAKDPIELIPNTEDYHPLIENDYRSPLDAPLSTFSIDVDHASYSNVRRFIQHHQQPTAAAVRTEEMINYFDYDYAQPSGDHPFSVYTELAPCPWNNDHQLLHIGLQGKEMKGAEMPASHLTFLIDVSGSMSDWNKLALLKPAFKLLIDQLRPQDRVAIVVYAGSAGLVLPSTLASDKKAIKAAIDNLSAGGSTAGGAGIHLAYKIAQANFIEGGNNRVILATDGDFNVGASSDGHLQKLIEEKRESGVFLTTLGFGFGNLKDNKLEILADKGNGQYAYIDNIREAKKVFVTELTGTLFTIAKDVKLQLEFNPQAVRSYRLIGYENRLLKDEDFNDDTKDAGELGAGHTVTAIYEIVRTNQLTDSSALKKVDDLKYQMQTTINNYDNELMTLKLRYKKSDAKDSELITHVVPASGLSADQTSDDFRFSAAVCGFSLLLRNSEYLNNWQPKQIIELAEGSKGKDSFGYRREFIDLVQQYELLGYTSAK